MSSDHVCAVCGRWMKWACEVGWQRWRCWENDGYADGGGRCEESGGEFDQAWTCERPWTFWKPSCGSRCQREGREWSLHDAFSSPVAAPLQHELLAGPCCEGGRCVACFLRLPCHRSCYPCPQLECLCHPPESLHRLPCSLTESLHRLPALGYCRLQSQRSCHPLSLREGEAAGGCAAALQLPSCFRHGVGGTGQGTAQVMQMGIG